MLRITDLPLATKLRVIIISVVGILLLISSTSSILYLTYDSYQSSVNLSRNQAKVVANNITAALAFQDEVGAMEVLGTMEDDAFVIGALLLDQEQQLFASLGDTLQMHQGLNDGLQLDEIDARSGWREIWIVEPVQRSGQPIGYLIVRTALTDVYENLLSQVLATLVILALMMFLVVPISRVLARSLSSPIESLKSTVAQISRENDFSIRASKISNDETGFLVDQINTMLEQLEERDRKLSKYSADLENTIVELEITKEAAVKGAVIKSQFLANMSHEIRTPMNGVVGMLDLLRDCALSSEQRDYVEIASHSATGLLSIINDILDLSKIEAGKMTLSPIATVPGDVIEEVISILYQVASRKEIELYSIIEPSGFDSFMIDPTRLRQVLMNLVGNAVKFTNTGHVLVRCEVISRELGASLRIRVEDTGIGIDKENKKSLFEAFGQADGSTTRKYGGTGLGLTICKQVVNLMGADIQFDSELDKGSVFFFDVPIQTADEQKYGFGMVGLEKLKIVTNFNSSFMEESVSKLLERLGVESVTEKEGTTETNVIITDDNNLMPMHGRAIHLVQRYSEKKKSDKVTELVLPVRFNLLRNALLEKQQQVRRFSHHLFVNSNNAKVLLVEDNAINQMVAARMLAKFGITCEKAEDGLEAVEKVSRERYDLIFMDCQMPRMDGFEATVKIRAYQEKTGARHTPIVALTANAMEEDEQRCLNAGMDDYLAKPIESVKMGRTLKHWLGPQSSHATPN